MFGALKAFDGFDVEGRVTIVDRDKYIENTYREAMEYSKLF